MIVQKIIKDSHNHSLKTQKIIQSNEFLYASFSQSKLIMRPSLVKVRTGPPVFLERTHSDTCGPIYPQCGPIRYFMVFNKCIYKIVTYVFIIKLQPSFCQTTYSNNLMTSHNFHIMGLRQFVSIMLMDLHLKLLMISWNSR